MIQESDDSCDILKLQRMETVDIGFYSLVLQGDYFSCFIFSVFHIPFSRGSVVLSSICDLLYYLVYVLMKVSIET